MDIAYLCCSLFSSKSFTAYRNKLQSPTLSTPFSLRTEERAARRKQASVYIKYYGQSSFHYKNYFHSYLYSCKYLQKLEEKFNAKEEKKVQQQTTLKVHFLMQNFLYGLSNVFSLPWILHHLLWKEGKQRKVVCELWGFPLWTLE